MTSRQIKQTLRADLRSARDGYVQTLSIAERNALEAAAVERLLAVLGGGAWASYLAMDSEIDPKRLAARAASGQPIAYPWFADREADMLFRLDDASLVRGPFGVIQPDAGQPIIQPDWIIVPLIGADRAGHRIGQGAGHYDRALGAMRAKADITTIGLAWDMQLIDSVPADPWDQPLDMIITPSQTIEARR